MNDPGYTVYALMMTPKEKAELLDHARLLKWMARVFAAFGGMEIIHDLVQWSGG